MGKTQSIASSLRGKLVALPESRQLDVLAGLFQRRGAAVLRVPLVSIRDTPDQASVLAWLDWFSKDPPDYLVVLTGEGLARLGAAAKRAGIGAEFGSALASTATVCRGPKPARVLKEFGLRPTHTAADPTTAGVMALLAELELAGSRLGVQLYGEDPNLPLMAFLERSQLVELRRVAPYVYADDSDDERVLDLITRLVGADVDLIAFTSKPQMSRLLRVARAAGRERELLQGLNSTTVAAVGPVVRDQLVAAGIRVDLMPAAAYFMKPLVRAAERHFQRSDPS